MSDDRFMAELLGEAPRTPDPGFRFDVFARIAERTRRRQAWERAALQIAAFTGVGLLVPVAQAAGLSQQGLLPMLMAGGAMALAGAFAWTMIAGPRHVWVRSRAVFSLVR